MQEISITDQLFLILIPISFSIALFVIGQIASIKIKTLDDIKYYNIQFN